MSDWQPIESAPSGNLIDVWIDGLSGKGWRVTGRIIGQEPLQIVDEDGCPYWPHENGGWATHWMPLPAPPSPKEPQQ